LWNYPYIGNKWGGKYLRALEIFFTILEKGKDKLVRLGDIEEVKFGIKIGANVFFILMTKKLKSGELKKSFLNPVIKSPRECKTIRIDIKSLSKKIIVCHKTKTQLKGLNILEYIKWGERQVNEDDVK